MWKSENIVGKVNQAVHKNRIFVISESWIFLTFQRHLSMTLRDTSVKLRYNNIYALWVSRQCSCSWNTDIAKNLNESILNGRLIVWIEYRGIFVFFARMTRRIATQKIATDGRTKFNDWVVNRVEIFYEKSIGKLAPRYDKRLNWNGDYVKKIVLLFYIHRGFKYVTPKVEEKTKRNDPRNNQTVKCV